MPNTNEYYPIGTEEPQRSLKQGLNKIQDSWVGFGQHILEIINRIVEHVLFPALLFLVADSWHPHYGIVNILLSLAKCWSLLDGSQLKFCHGM